MITSLMKKKKKKVTKKVLVTGTLRVHPRGFGFLIPDDKEKFPEDIFIPKHLTNGAIDGDSVEVSLKTDSISEKGPEGEVLTVLKRGHSHVAGTITHVFSKGDALAYVPLLGSNSSMRIQKSAERPFSVGDRLIILVLKWGKESSGQMSSYLGSIADPSCDVPSLLVEFEIKSQFPNECIEEAKKFGKTVSKKDLENREDLRELECFTIDPDTAKDFDDALSLSQDSQGQFHLGVHIADVSHYVKPNSALDKEAKVRCNSVYFPGTVIPMLPHELSSHLCSLKPDVNRLTISVLMTLDKEGTLLNYRICRSVILSQKRFTYKEAKEVLDGKKSKHRNTLLLMEGLCLLLKKKRFERGSIEFTVPGTSLYVDKNGVPEKIELVEYDISHQLVEEFMLKANEIVATHLGEKGKPLPYRVHDAPNEENIKDFALLASAFGFKTSKDPTIEELQQIFEEAKGTSFAPFLATAFIRSMKLANYSIQNIGHYGLGLDFYTHFTSPIRRYVDLVVHRALFDEFENDLEKVALQCSEKERLSAKAENAAILLKKLRLLDAEHKKEPQKHYEAVITEIKPFGIVFTVSEFFLDGFLPLSAIEEDFFIFDPRSKTLLGTHGHKTYRCGDKIEVKVLHLNLIFQETKWKIVEKKRKKR